MGTQQRDIHNTVRIPGTVRARPVEVDQQLPVTTEVVIVGGGIAGVCTALYLARMGIDCVLCEKGHIAGEQSSRAFGWICNLGLDPLKMELSSLSKRLWHEVADDVGHQALGYRKTGLLHLCNSEADLAHEQAWLEAVAGCADIDAHLLSTAQLAEHLPGNRRSYAGAVFQPSDGRVEPRLATSVLADLARRAGAKLFAPCAVRGIETSAGKVSAVVTEREVIRCSQVVVAGGAWSRLFCGNAGVQLPQLSIHSSLMRIAPLPGGPSVCAAADGFAFRQDADGGYVFGPSSGHTAPVTLDSFRLFFDFLPALRNQWRQMKVSVGRAFFDDLRIPRRWALDQVSPFERQRMLDPAPDVALNLRTLANMAQAFPAFSHARVVDHWAGMIDATPDSVPVIGPVAEVPGLFINSGFSAYGLTLGPAAGLLLAEQLAGRTPNVAGHAYRFARFSDGSRLRVAP